MQLKLAADLGNVCLPGGGQRVRRGHTVVCLRAGDKTGGLDMEERRESENLKLTCLLQDAATDMKHEENTKIGCC